MLKKGKVKLAGFDAPLLNSTALGASAVGGTCTGLQLDLMQAYFWGRAAEFLALSRLVDELAEVLFVSPMEGYIGRVLWALVHEGIIGRESSHDPWGPKLRESEFAEIGEVLHIVSQFEHARRD